MKLRLFPLESREVPYSAGDLVASFGNGGKVLFPVGSFGDVAQNGVVQTDGKLVAVGHTYNGTNYDVVVARFLTNGDPDGSFGSGGKVVFSWGSGEDFGYGVAVDSQSRIVIGGGTSNGAQDDFAVARLLPNGAFDTTFSGDGKLVFAFNPTLNDTAFAVAVDSADNVILAGPTGVGNSDMAVARVLGTTGALDTTFDGDGKAITPVGPDQDVPQGVVVQGDGKIVIGGFAFSGTFNDFALVRYNTNGSLDSTFDGDGIVTTNFISNHDQGTCIVRQPDGKLIVGGLSNNNYGNLDFALARYNTNGSLDTSFGSNGKVITPLGTVEDVGRSVAVDQAGRVILAGYSFTGGINEATLVRYTPNGAIDTTFGTAGKVVTSLGLRSTISSLVVGVNGDLIGVGAAFNGINDDIALFHYHSESDANRPPVLANAPISINVDEGVTATFDANATDLDGDALTYSLIGAPFNASINSSTGEFSWSPLESQAPNTYVFQVSVSDGVDTDVRTVTAIAREVNTAPALSGGTLIGSVVVGETFTYTAVANDADRINGSIGNKLTYSLVNAPAGASIDPDTGALTWTVSDAISAGTYNFSLRVTDDGVPSMSDSIPVTITVRNVGVVGGNLVIGGTAGNDDIAVIDYPRATQPHFLVRMNGTIIGRYTFFDVPGTTITVRGLSGNDKIDLSKVSPVYTTFLDGGTGNDTLMGSSQIDQLDGGPGSDRLIGGKGSDRYLFSDSWGQDTITESRNAGNDVLDFAGLPNGTGVIVMVGPRMSASSGVNTLAAMGGHIESVVGSASNDTVGAVAGTNKWIVNGANQGTIGTTSFSGFENIAGGAGVDQFQMVSGASLSGTLSGGAGVDTLDYSSRTSGIVANLTLGSATGAGVVSLMENVIGGSGDDLIVGNDGKNSLVGGAGRDVLIGGRGADTLTGGNDDDLLISGFTAFDANAVQLGQIVAEWTSASTFADRRSHLAGPTAGLNGTTFLTLATVSDDSTKDLLTGSTGEDWVLVHTLDVATLAEAITRL